MSKRPTILPTAVVCENAVIEGDVTIGSGTIIQTDVSIIAENGPIIIGSNNIIGEQVTIYNRSGKPLTIGDENTIETRAYIECQNIGHRNIIQTCGKVTGISKIGNNCIVGLGCSLAYDEEISDGTVVYGRDNMKRIRNDDNNDYLETLNSHLDYLREVIPKYNVVRKVN